MTPEDLNLSPRYCKCCGTELPVTVYKSGTYYAEKKTIRMYLNKQFCNGGCANTYRVQQRDMPAIDEFLRRALV